MTTKKSWLHYSVMPIVICCLLTYLHSTEATESINTVEPEPVGSLFSYFKLPSVTLPSSQQATDFVNSLKPSQETLDYVTDLISQYAPNADTFSRLAGNIQNLPPEQQLALIGAIVAATAGGMYSWQSSVYKRDNTIYLLDFLGAVLEFDIKEVQTWQHHIDPKINYNTLEARLKNVLPLEQLLRCIRSIFNDQTNNQETKNEKICLSRYYLLVLKVYAKNYNPRCLDDIIIKKILTDNAYLSKIDISTKIIDEINKALKNPNLTPKQKNSLHLYNALHSFPDNERFINISRENTLKKWGNDIFPTGFFWNSEERTAFDNLIKNPDKIYSQSFEGKRERALVKGILIENLTPDVKWLIVEDYINNCIENNQFKAFELPESKARRKRLEEEIKFPKNQLPPQVEKMKIIGGESTIKRETLSKPISTSDEKNNEEIAQAANTEITGSESTIKPETLSKPISTSDEKNNEEIAQAANTKIITDNEIEGYIENIDKLLKNIDECFEKIDELKKKSSIEQNIKKQNELDITQTNQSQVGTDELKTEKPNLNMINESQDKSSEISTKIVGEQPKNKLLNFFAKSLNFFAKNFVV